MWLRAPRQAVLLSSCALSFSCIVLSQTQTPKKVLTPEQQAYQQQIRVIDQQRESLRAEANQSFDSEMARQKAGDCPNAVTTLDANTCLGREVAVTNQNLESFEDALRRLIGLQYPKISLGNPSAPPA